MSSSSSNVSADWDPESTVPSTNGILDCLSELARDLEDPAVYTDNVSTLDGRTKAFRTAEAPPDALVCAFRGLDHFWSMAASQPSSPTISPLAPSIPLLDFSFSEDPTVERLTNFAMAPKLRLDQLPAQGEPLPSSTFEKDASARHFAASLLSSVTVSSQVGHWLRLMALDIRNRSPSYDISKCLENLASLSDVVTHGQLPSLTSAFEEAALVRQDLRVELFPPPFPPMIHQSIMRSSPFAVQPVPEQDLIACLDGAYRPFAAYRDWSESEINVYLQGQILYRPDGPRRSASRPSRQPSERSASLRSSERLQSRRSAPQGTRSSPRLRSRRPAPQDKRQ